jgi:hypothetical protein
MKLFKKIKSKKRKYNCSECGKFYVYVGSYGYMKSGYGSCDCGKCKVYIN